MWIKRLISQPHLCASQGTFWRFNPSRHRRLERDRPLEGHRLDARIPRRGRDELRVVRVLPARAATFRSALSSLRVQSQRRRASSKCLDRQIGEYRILSIQLSATAPLRDHCTEWRATQIPAEFPPYRQSSSQPQSRLLQFTLSALYYAPGCKSVPSLAQRAPSSVTLRFAQGKPSVHPRLIPFATLKARLRSIFALSCFVRSPNSQPLTTFILSTFPHQQRWSHLFIHFVHFFLNKATIVCIFAAFR